MNDAYHSVRFNYAPERAVVWREIARYMQRYIRPSSCVVELGAGYCDFINAVQAQEKIAVDLFRDIALHAAEGVAVFNRDATDLSMLDDASVDVVFASNFFEHLDREQFETCIGEVRRILRPEGNLLVVQPNFRFFAKYYFDDYTHKTVFSHVTMQDWLQALGLRVEEVHGRFLPASMKSRLPKWPVLIRAYLHSPFKPLAGQFFIRAVK